MIAKRALAVVGIATLPLATSACKPPAAGETATPSSAICKVGGTANEIGKIGLNKKQTRNAVIVIRVAVERDLPRRAAVIGIATTLQESYLDNGVVGDDGTAFGIFQQRPVSGWGTVETATTPEVAAGKFYDQLVKVKRWKKRPLTEAAQAVQRSAYPNAYAKHEDEAEQIVAKLTPRACKEAGR
ncbi:hypothetical protein FXF51_02275 [Nonomuraea sp. PA05]|uniref:hypothetical protein n=1 Tax=Nonomuraea sp. PA05 TaxID=2604466 RepID=UPI0011DB7207|nr:hypothetical protein [Nonomuraea sp. PA05]TYB71280.1 hypothetical protein FXF51_02275 [Nonomuraea sp. PA05]